MRESTIDLSGSYVHHLKPNDVAYASDALLRGNDRAQNDISMQRSRLISRYRPFFLDYRGGMDGDGVGVNFQPYHNDIMSVHHYTGSMSNHLNSNLVDLTRDRPGHLQAHHEALQRVFSDSPGTPEHIFSYAGLCLNRHKMVQGLSVGQRVHFPAYTSTSINPEQSCFFALRQNKTRPGGYEEHSHFAQFSVPQGHKALYVEPVSKNQLEQELLLPHGTNTTYTGTTTHESHSDNPGGRFSHHIHVHKFSVHK